MMETTELTEYERDRTPQEITLDTEMVISPRSLYREIVCPICLDILSQTRAAPDCLHRFCKKCVDRVVKKKECPVCRKKLPSQSNKFREDPKFDQLIAKIYGGYRADQLEINRDIAPPECEIVLKHLHGSQTRYLKCPERTTIDHLKRYLAIRPEGAKMPNLDNNEKFGLCIMGDRSKGQYEVLSGKLRLDEIKSSYKLDTEKPLEFYFYNPPEG